MPDTSSGQPFGSVLIEVTVRVGQSRPTLTDLMSMREGSVLPLDTGVDDPVELYVGDKLVARGTLEEGKNGSLDVRLTDVAGMSGA